MTAEHFTEKLESLLSGVEGVSLKINDAQACPHFEIAGTDNVPIVQGYYCESGDSFIQVGLSGREAFTNDDASALRFLTLIRDIVHEVGYHGCTEKRWAASDGKIRRSAIKLPLSGSKAFGLGQSPHFWQIGLKPSTEQLGPFLTKSS